MSILFGVRQRVSATTDGCLVQEGVSCEPHFSMPLVPSWAVRRSGRGPRPRLAVGRKTSGGRAWQVKVVEVTSGQDMEDQTNRAKSEQDTSNNVDSLSRIAF